MVVAEEACPGVVDYHASANCVVLESAMLDQEAIQEQLTLLRLHRRTLAHYLEQRALLGKAYEPPAVAHGIVEGREQIARIKKLLRENGVTVEDEPSDVTNETRAHEEEVVRLELLRVLL
jgi:hypothetical protein